MDINEYRKINESFRRRLVYHVGKDCGFFVELNYMLNAMIYCLVLRIQFQIYSADANFGTGVGWMEYFQPFCQEVHEKYHATYNLYGIEGIIIMFTAYWPGWYGGHNRHCNSRWLMPAG